MSPHPVNFSNKSRFLEATPNRLKPTSCLRLSPLLRLIVVIPKINYPLPCVSLTQAQCRYIQAPVLEAILPKLHLNRHTPRAVLFAGPQYGGLSLLETYTDLGHGHLSYFIGHLKLGDDVGNLIRTLITHTQLQLDQLHSFSNFLTLSIPSGLIPPGLQISGRLPTKHA